MQKNSSILSTLAFLSILLGIFSFVGCGKEKTGVSNDLDEVQQFLNDHPELNEEFSEDEVAE